MNCDFMKALAALALHSWPRRKVLGLRKQDRIVARCMPYKYNIYALHSPYDLCRRINS